MSQCIGAGMGALGLAGAYDGIVGPIGWAGSALAYDGLAGPLGYDGLYGYGRGIGCGVGPAMDFTPTSGGGLSVTSASTIPPVGLSVVSENVYEGILAAAGDLPFVGTVAVEGILPTAGAGAINHACGNGVNAMVSETTAFAPGFAGAYAPGLGYAGVGAGLGYAGAVGTGLGYADVLAPGLGYAGLWLAVEGVLPTAGAGAISHACGNGVNAMLSETTAFAPGLTGAYGLGLGYGGTYDADLGYAGAFGTGLGYAPGLGYAGWAGRGCGYVL